MHEYYTPNLNKMQGFLANFTIFVDYDHFYVNAIMLTSVTGRRIFIQNVQMLGHIYKAATKYCFCKKKCKIAGAGKSNLPAFNFVQLNDRPRFSVSFPACFSQE